MARFSSSLWFLEVDRIAWTQVSPWPLAKDSLQSAERSQLQHFRVGKKLKKSGFMEDQKDSGASNATVHFFTHDLRGQENWQGRRLMA